MSHWPDICEALTSISREAGKCLLVWLIALPTKSGSVVKERMGIGYTSGSFIFSTNSYKWNCWIKTSHTFNISIVPSYPPKGFYQVHFYNAQESLFPYIMAQRLLPNSSCFANPMGEKWSLIIFICYLSIVSGVEHLFMCLNTLAFKAW